MKQQRRWVARVGSFIAIVSAMIGGLVPTAQAAATLTVDIVPVSSPLLSGQQAQWRIRYQCSSVDPSQTACLDPQIKVSVPDVLPSIAAPYVTYNSVGDAYWNKAVTPTGGPVWEWVFSAKSGSIPVGVNGELIVQVTPPDWWTPDGVSMDATAAFSSSNAGTVTDGPASVVFNATPSIAITKFNPGSVVRDVPVTYMIWGTGWGLNGGFGQSGMPFGTGHLSLEDATIVDTLPAGALYVSSNPPGTYDPTSHTVTWSNPTDTRVVYVTVTYPSSVFAITDTVTNGAVITGHPLADPDTELVARDAVTHSFAEFNPGSVYTKDVARATAQNPQLLTLARSPFVLEGGNGFFWFHTIRNTGNGPIGGVISDVMPCAVTSPASATPVCATPGFHLASFGFSVGPAPATIEWVASDGTAGTYPVTPADVAAGTVSASALGMPSGTELASFRAVYAETIQAGTSTQLLVQGSLTDAFPADTYTQTNCGSFSMIAAGTTYPSSAAQCPTAVFRAPRVVWGVSKWPEVRSGAIYTFPDVTNRQPGDAILWRLTASNWGEVASSPEIVDLLPATLDYDPSVPVTAYLHPLNPGTLKPVSGASVVVTPNYNGTGRTLVRVVLPAGFTVPAYSNTGDMSVSVYFGTKIRAGAPIGTWVNPARVYDASGTFSCVNGYSVPDSDNLSGFGVSSPVCPGDATFSVAASANAGATKLVKGDADATFMPGVGQSLSGGSSQWQINIGNYGNVTPLTNVIAYDIFPYVGDTGVSEGQVTVPRLTEFVPTLDGPVTAPAGVTISYSQSSNPCRPELIPTGPLGCDDDWSTSFPGPGMAKAIRIDGGSLVLDPGEFLTLTYTMGLPATAEGGQIAWNSVAFRATRTDDGRDLMPTEPPKVGIKIIETSVGDFVWYDTNRDGLQTAGEPPYGGMTVELYAANAVVDVDSPLATTTTDPTTGYYSFTGLTAGRDYLIRFVKDPLESFTTQDVTVNPDDAQDSDADPGLGVVWVTAPTSGSNLASNGVDQWADNSSVDAGIVRYNLTLEKEADATAGLYPGDMVTYTLTPRNEGPSDALPGWSVTDLLPVGVAFVSVTAPGYECSTGHDVAGQFVTCVSTATGLAAGADAPPIQIQGLVQGAWGGCQEMYRNVAYVARSPADAEETVPLVVPTRSTDTTNTDTDNDDSVQLCVGWLVSVGDFVWVDANRNGVQDGGGVCPDGAGEREPVRRRGQPPDLLVGRCVGLLLLRQFEARAELPGAVPGEPGRMDLDDPERVR